jgi:hypothetical protein
MSRMLTFKRLARILLPAAAVAAVAAPAATAAPAGPSAAYGIVSSTLAQLAKDRGANVTAASAKVKPCLGTFETLLPTNGKTSLPPAATALVTELTATYDASALQTPLGQLSAMGTRLGKLHQPTRQIKALAAFVPTIKALDAVDFCADVNAWSAHAFAAAFEPAGTRNAAVATTKFALPNAALNALTTDSHPLGLKLSRSQVKKLHAAAKQAVELLSVANLAASTAEASLVAVTPPSTPTGPTGPSGPTGATGPTS